MTFPSQTLTVRDPGIGVTAQASGAPVLSGIAHGGSTSTGVLASISDPGQIRAQIGYGQLAEDVALALQKFGGPVFYVIHSSAQSVTLTTAAMTQTGSVSPPAVTVSGSPNDYYNLRVEVMVGGTRGTATFRFSLDAWDANYAPFTQSAVRATAATYAIANSGLTLNFPAGTYVAGDVYSLSTVPQEVGSTDLSAVATVLENAAATNFFLWLVSGMQPDATTGASLAAALSGYLTTLTNSFRYVRAFLDVGSIDTAANVKTAAAGWTSNRVSPAYGYVIRAVADGMAFEGWSYRKCSCSAGIGVRAMSELISSDLSRTAAGADEGVVKIVLDGFYDQTVDAAQISTMRTWAGIPGFYIANAKLKCSFGSDFTDLQFGRVMDVACRTTYEALFPFQSASFRVRTDGTGQIDPRDAKQVEAPVNNSLADNLLRQNNARGIPGHVSAVNYAVDLTVNLLTTGQLKGTVAIVPLGYAKTIATDLFFTASAA
jgi:hypothetical protein